MNYHDLACIISPERLKTYLNNANNNHDEAIKLYLENLKHIQRYFPIIIEFEVLLRNAINHELIDAYGETWYEDTSIFIDKQKQDIDNTMLRCAKKKGQTINCDMVAGLSLGFWINLFNSEYDKTLWRQHLHKIFNGGIQRSTLRGKLKTINQLRNRIAHCDYLSPKQQDNMQLVFEVGEMIQPDFLNWINQINKTSN